MDISLCLRSCCSFNFWPTGKLVGHLGGHEATDQHFAGLHLVNKNEIVAIDFHNHSMKVDGAGRVPLQVWLPQEGNGQFNAPTGVAVDSSSSILVADQGSVAPGRCTALGPSCPHIKSAEPS